LENLRDIGNTVLVVEPDEEMMRSADHILDIGLYAENSAAIWFLKAILKNCSKMMFL
jgi:excinuclease UvrABC ATPase subunit